MKNITVSTKNIKHNVSPMLYGIFFEDINYAGDGGLYGELVANRSFEYYDRDNAKDFHQMRWETLGDASIQILTYEDEDDQDRYYAEVTGSKGSGIKNQGYCGEGFAVKEGMAFHFECIARISDSPMSVKLRITDGKAKIFSEEMLSVSNDSWQKLSLTLMTSEEYENAYLELILAESGSLELDYVSLFPKETFNNRVNGMRKDMADMLAGLTPKFLRFPGGCIVEGRNFPNMYNWKDTIGPVEKRRTNWNRWQMEEYQQCDRDSGDYFQSYGIGFYEYFLLSEDLGAKPVPIVNAGMTCQWHEGLLVPMDELDPWIQDVLDLIEFANGDSTTQWGKKRIEMGHTEPFNLEYIGIGNEQWGKVYFDRYEKFYEIISEKHPEIKLITSAGWTADGNDFDEAVAWMENNKEKAYAVDEHFYKSPQWFLDSIHRYDDYDRTMPKVFAGEYAAHTTDVIPDRKNNWYAALTEAAFLTGVENNSDHVVMTCYAPLFARDNHQQWQPDLIWFNNSQCFGTPSYYVQQLFANYVGDQLVESQTDDEDVHVSATMDEDGLRMVLKVVNLSEEDKAVSVNVDDTYDKITKYAITAHLDAENSFAEPTNVCPETREVAIDDKPLTIKGNSVTVLIMEKKLLDTRLI